METGATNLRHVCVKPTKIKPHSPEKSKNCHNTVLKDNMRPGLLGVREKKLYWRKRNISGAGF